MNPYRENVISNVNEKSKFRGLVLPILVVAAIAHVALFYVYIKHYNSEDSQAQSISNTVTMQNQDNASNNSANNLTNNIPPELAVIESVKNPVEEVLNNTIKPIVIQAEVIPETNIDTTKTNDEENTSNVNNPQSSSKENEPTTKVASNVTTNTDNTAAPNSPNVNSINDSTGISSTIPAIINKTTKTISTGKTSTEDVSNNSTGAENSQLTTTNNNTQQTATKKVNETVLKQTKKTVANSKTANNKKTSTKASHNNQSHNKVTTNKKPRPIEPIKEYKGDTYSITPDIIPALIITQTQTQSNSKSQSNNKPTYQPVYKPMNTSKRQTSTPQSTPQQAIHDAKLLDIDVPKADLKTLPVKVQAPQNQQIKSDMKALHKELAQNIEAIKLFNKKKITRERQVSKQAYQDKLYIEQLKQKEALNLKIEDTEAQLEKSVSLLAP